MDFSGGSWRNPGTCGEELDCLASGRECGGGFLPDRCAPRGHWSRAGTATFAELTGSHILVSMNMVHTVCP